MMTFLTVLQVIACLLIVVTVLLQPAKGGASAFGGSSQGVFGASGGTNFLFKTTMVCAGFLMLSSLLMAGMKIRDARSSVIDNLSAPPPVSAPAVPAPVDPMVPVKPAPTPAPLPVPTK